MILHKYFRRINPAMLLEKVWTNVSDQAVIKLWSEDRLWPSQAESIRLRLAHIFLSLCVASLNIQLHIASLNHGIRGAQRSKRDVRFVARLARRVATAIYGRPVADVPQLALQHRIRHRRSGTARARYKFPGERRGGNLRAQSVAVGHHALDQAETILMHIVKRQRTAGIARNAILLADAWTTRQ